MNKLKVSLPRMLPLHQRLESGLTEMSGSVEFFEMKGKTNIVKKPCRPERRLLRSLDIGSLLWVMGVLRLAI
jgi:hypothetical protein